MFCCACVRVCVCACVRVCVCACVRVYVHTGLGCMQVATQPTPPGQVISSYWLLPTFHTLPYSMYVCMYVCTYLPALGRGGWARWARWARRVLRRALLLALLFHNGTLLLGKI